ncbi:MAG TPA: hypothetical protein VJP78_16060 [Thermoleophilia bacterium]|nr:hypothetical protein [Thermoleophilia bacterium]
MVSISIIVSPRGVERAVTLGPGLQETRESYAFLETIWPEVQEFHRAVVHKLGKTPSRGPRKPLRAAR